MLELIACGVIALVLLAVGLCVRSTVLWRRKCRARIAKDGVQEIEVIVRGGFDPSTVVVKQGIPARLYFNRQEDGACSRHVIFSGLRQDRWLAPFATTAVQFIPTRPGEYMFTSSEGAYQGRLVVEE